MQIKEVKKGQWLECITMIIKLLPNDNFQSSELQTWLEFGTGKIFASIIKNNITGVIFVCEYFQQKDKFVYIQSLCVDPNYRKLNIGAQLISYICNKYTGIYIWAKVSNHNLVAKILFIKIGFRQCAQKCTPPPLSKDFNTIYYPYVYESISSTWNIYAEECLLNNLIKRFY